MVSSVSGYNWRGVRLTLLTVLTIVGSLQTPELARGPLLLRPPSPLRGGDALAAFRRDRALLRPNLLSSGRRSCYRGPSWAALRLRAYRTGARRTPRAAL